MSLCLSFSLLSIWPSWVAMIIFVVARAVTVIIGETGSGKTTQMTQVRFVFWIFSFHSLCSSACLSAPSFSHSFTICASVPVDRQILVVRVVFIGRRLRQTWIDWMHGTTSCSSSWLLFVFSWVVSCRRFACFVFFFQTFAVLLINSLSVCLFNSVWFDFTVHVLVV